MRQTLTSLLKEHANSQAEAARLQQERQERFEKEVREALVRIESKRAQDQVSPRGGFDFEDAVVEFVTAAVRGAPCIADATGNTAGLRTRCKKGDLVIRFTEESAFNGVGVVFEAKRDSSYGAQKAIAERASWRPPAESAKSATDSARLLAVSIGNHRGESLARRMHTRASWRKPATPAYASIARKAAMSATGPSKPTSTR